MKDSSASQDFSLENGKRLRFHATDIRKERTGVHAVVAILLDADLLAYNNFNIERDEDRTRLANAAAGAMGKLDAEVWPKEQMRKALAVWSLGVWEAAQNKIEIGPMAGKHREGGPQFFVHGFIIAGGGTIIFAPPGRGKSFTGMLLTTSIDAGTGYLFPIAEPHRSLYINIERSADSQADRLARVNAAIGLEAERPLAFINQRGRPLIEIIDRIEKYVRQEGIEFVMLDSISRAGFGDLNENASTNKLVDAMNWACPTWAAIAHTSRQDESHVYGSIHFDAGVDIAVKLTTQDGPEGSLGIGLTVTKGNDVARQKAPLTFVLEFEETGLSGVRGVGRGEFLLLDQGPQLSVGAQVQDFLMRYGEASATTVAKETGLNRSTVAHELARATWVQHRKVGKDVLYQVKYTGQED